MSGPGSTESQVSFGPFVYDRQRKQLYRQGAPVDLQPKHIETLHAMALRPGEVVDKSELMKSVWPDTIVEESGLARNISQLRKALGEPPGDETYIQTIPRRGYRLVTSRSPRKRQSRRRRLLAAGIAAGILVLVVYWQFYLPSRWLQGGAGRADLAVMPFLGEPQGFSAALASELAGYSHIRVISPSTIRRYRFIGIPDHWTARFLGVDVMIDGDWPPAGSSLGGAARLTDVHSGRMIWSGRLKAVSPEEAVKSISMAVAGRLEQPR